MALSSRNVAVIASSWLVALAAGAVLDTRARAAGVAWVDGRCAVAPRSLLVLRDDPDDGCGRMRGEAR